jgi:peptidoglycan/xylan/chitin deacetylase (PgdA/CDA1 family)
MMNMLLRFIKLLISLIVLAWDFTEESKCRLLGKKSQPKCVVLYYHCVEKQQAERFAHQLDIIRKTAQIIPSDKVGALRNGKHYVVITFDDGFVDLIENALPELSKQRIPATIFVPTGYLGRVADWFRKNGDKSKKVMDAEQLKHITNNELILIGSHCVTHSSLLSMTDNEAKNELIQSKNQLENTLGKNIVLLSYPHGEFSKSHVELAREAGYKRAFSIEPTLMRLTSDEFVVGRVNTNPNDWGLEFYLKIMGAYRWITFASSLKSRIISNQITSKPPNQM